MKKSYDFSQRAKNPNLKRIIVSVKIENAFDLSKSLRCDAFVDSRVSLMVLPAVWKGRLGRLESTRIIAIGNLVQGAINVEACGPVRIQIEGFRPIHTELVFVELESDVEEFKPLLGHIVLAQSQATVDLPGNRLVQIKHVDLK